MFLRFVFVAVLSAVAGQSSAAISDVTCDDRSRLTKTLELNLQAQRHGAGLRDPDTMLEVWVSPASGDWIIVQHYASGTSCIVAIGEHWEATQPNPA